MICTILCSVFFVVYVLSVIEIIGSWILTKKYQNISWDLEFQIIPIIIPFIAPIAAYDSIYYANMLYTSKKHNEHHWQESLYEWLKHNRLSIDEWANTH